MVAFSPLNGGPARLDTDAVSLKRSLLKFMLHKP